MITLIHVIIIMLLFLDKSKLNCDALQILYDPESTGLGDLGARLGPVNIGKKSLIRDTNLATFDIEYESRALYMVLFDSERIDNILDCAQINLKKSITLKLLYFIRNY